MKRFLLLPIDSTIQAAYKKAVKAAKWFAIAGSMDKRKKTPDYIRSSFAEGGQADITFQLVLAQLLRYAVSRRLHQLHEQNKNNDANVHHVRLPALVAVPNRHIA